MPHGVGVGALGQPLGVELWRVMRLLRKRLKGVSPEQVDLGDLTLTHFKATRGATLEGVAANEPAPELSGITDNGTRDARDREKKYLSELVARLKEALGKAISDKDKVAFAVHVSERLPGDATVMAQAQNNPRDQAMRAALPKAAIQAISAAMLSHHEVATKLLGPDDASRDLFLSVIYEMLKNRVRGDLFGAEGV